MEEELASLSAIFAGDEYMMLRNATQIQVLLPLRFKWLLQVDIDIASHICDVTTLFDKTDSAPPELHRIAASAAQFKAAIFMADKQIGEHKDIYGAHQKALGAFDEIVFAHASGTEKIVGPKRDIILDMSDDEPVPSPRDLLQTTVIILDHINDSKIYYKALSKWATQLSLSCIVLAKNPMSPRVDRIKNAVVIIQSSDGNEEFMRRLKTENVDVNMAGKACKERCSSTIHVSRKFDYLEAGTFFKVIDCNTTDAIKMIKGSYNAPEIADLVGDFCLGRK